MKRIFLIITLILGVSGTFAKKQPERKHIIACMERVNDYFMAHHHPDDDSIRTSQTYPSNAWTRSIYLEGLMALNDISPQSRYTEYALIWAETNQWNFHGGMHTLKADNQCCGQTYIDLYRLYHHPQAIANVERLLNNIVNNTTHNDWDEVNAIRTAMPLYARMGNLKKDLRYFEKMMELYRHVRNRIGLYNPTDGLWWQSAQYMPSYQEPNGTPCYWSRGNGWVIAGLARTIEEIDKVLPELNGENRQKLQNIRCSLAEDFMATVTAVQPLQRKDGFWNCSLTDPLHYGGPETSSTALFIYGMAWGVRKQMLSPDVYLPVITKGWQSIMEKAVHPEGFLGYIQGEGKEPKDGQPVTYASRQNGNDFGTGCFLMAGAEIIRLLSQLK